MGLETITIYILQKSTELLNAFRSSSMSKSSAISLINGEIFTQVELYSDLSYLGYEYLQKFSSEFTEKSIDEMRWWTYLDFFILSTICMCTYKLVAIIFVDRLNLDMKRNKELE